MDTSSPVAGKKHRRLRKLGIGLLIFVAFIVAAGFIPIDFPLVRNSFESALRGTGADSVHVGHASVTLWRGVALDSLFLSRPDPLGGRFSTRIPELRVSFRIFPLLVRHLAFRSITINKPQITMTQKRVAPPVPAKPLDLDTLVESFSKLPFTFSIKEMAISDGNLTVLDGRKAVVRAQGLNLQLGFRKIVDAEGKASITKVILERKWEIEDVDLRFRTVRTRFLLDQAKARFYGGDFSSSATLELSRNRLEEAKIALKGLDIARIYAVTDNPGEVKGKADFELNLNRSRFSVAALLGNGKVEIKDLTAINMPIQKKLLVLLLVPDLAQLHFSSIRSEFTLRNKRVLAPDIQGKGEPLSFGSKGWVDFDGGLSQEATLFLEQKSARGLPPQIKNGMEQASDGRYYFGLDISGTFEEPRIALQKRYQERAVEELLRNVTNGIFNYLQNR